MRRDYLIFGVLTIVVGAVLFELSTNLKDDSNRDLYSFILFAASIAASFLFGILSVRKSAREMLKPHARSAVNRLTSLASGANDLVDVIGKQRDRAEADAYSDGGDGTINVAALIAMHEVTQIQMRSQIRTAADATEDWRDFIPEEVSDAGGEMADGD